MMFKQKLLLIFNLIVAFFVCCMSRNGCNTKHPWNNRLSHFKSSPWVNSSKVKLMDSICMKQYKQWLLGNVYIVYDKFGNVWSCCFIYQRKICNYILSLRLQESHRNSTLYSTHPGIIISGTTILSKPMLEKNNINKFKQSRVPVIFMDNNITKYSAPASVLLAPPPLRNKFFVPTTKQHFTKTLTISTSTSKLWKQKKKHEVSTLYPTPPGVLISSFLVPPQLMSEKNKLDKISQNGKPKAFMNDNFTNFLAPNSVLLPPPLQNSFFGSSIKQNITTISTSFSSTSTLIKLKEIEKNSAPFPTTTGILNNETDASSGAMPGTDKLNNILQREKQADLNFEDNLTLKLNNSVSSLPTTQTSILYTTIKIFTTNLASSTFSSIPWNLKVFPKSTSGKNDFPKIHQEKKISIFKDLNVTINLAPNLTTSSLSTLHFQTTFAIPTTKIFITKPESSISLSKLRKLKDKNKDFILNSTIHSAIIGNVTTVSSSSMPGRNNLNSSLLSKEKKILSVLNFGKDLAPPNLTTLSSSSLSSQNTFFDPTTKLFTTTSESFSSTSWWLKDKHESSSLYSAQPGIRKNFTVSLRPMAEAKNLSSILQKGKPADPSLKNDLMPRLTTQLPSSLASQSTTKLANLTTKFFTTNSERFNFSSTQWTSKEKHDTSILNLTHSEIIVNNTTIRSKPLHKENNFDKILQKGRPVIDKDLKFENNLAPNLTTLAPSSLSFPTLFSDSTTELFTTNFKNFSSTTRNLKDDRKNTTFYSTHIDILINGTTFFPTPKSGENNFHKTHQEKKTSIFIDFDSRNNSASGSTTPVPSSLPSQTPFNDPTTKLFTTSLGIFRSLSTVKKLKESTYSSSRNPISNQFDTIITPTSGKASNIYSTDLTTNLFLPGSNRFSTTPRLTSISIPTSTTPAVPYSENSSIGVNVKKNVYGKTAFGEECKNECAKRNYDYTWCVKKIPSNVGPWINTAYCSITPNTTSHGEDCVDRCYKRGEFYTWCNTLSSWGYCSPSSLKQTKVPAARISFTVYGEQCKDACEYRGYKYTWCHKLQVSKIGTWRHSDYCSSEKGVTVHGGKCLNECGQHEGTSYNWCKTIIWKRKWDYCTPSILLVS